jgi:hypothetical protein
LTLTFLSFPTIPQQLPDDPGNVPAILDLIFVKNGRDADGSRY